jgi:hypothetical protein
MNPDRAPYNPPTTMQRPAEAVSPRLDADERTATMTTTTTTTTTTYRMTSRTSGAYLGAYSGATVEGAHEALCRDAGYASAASCAEALGTTVEALIADLIAIEE